MDPAALQGLLLAILKILLKQFPQLGPAVILAELENLAEGLGNEFIAWWNSFPQNDPWPVNPDIPVPPPEDGTGV